MSADVVEAALALAIEMLKKGEQTSEASTAGVGRDISLTADGNATLGAG
jgi:hypothetical protein